MNDDTSFSVQKYELMDRLEYESMVFQNKAIKAAFEAIDRKDFVLPDYTYESYEDYALPTLDGQIMLQPTTTAFMLELLDPQPGDSVLDIGSGTGWTAALLGHMVGSEGKVIGLEIRPELVAISQKNIATYKNLPISIIQAENETGYYREAPYNRIISSVALPHPDDSATTETIVAELLIQLAVGGVMIIPIGDTILKLEKESEEHITESEYPGFNFMSYE